MPLSTPTVARQRLHERRVTYEGFERDDGLFDVDAHLADIKDHDFLLLTGNRPAGEPVHAMHVRVTIDREYTIHAIEARTDRMPYPGACDQIGPAYQKLVGANLVKGFRKRLHDTMGGVHGCTISPNYSAIYQRPPYKHLPDCGVRTMAHRNLFNSTAVTPCVPMVRQSRNITRGGRSNRPSNLNPVSFYT